jgi:hypothetical protein
MIRNETDLERHVDYIHYNPVKHGLVARVSDWPYSSFHRYVARGDLPIDWGGDVREIAGEFGERSKAVSMLNWSGGQRRATPCLAERPCSAFAHPTS